MSEETPTDAQSKESVTLSDLFRVNRMELFGIDEKYLEDLLAEAPGRESKELLQRRSTRNVLPAMDEGETVQEGGDTPQLYSLLLHFAASMGHGAFGPWALQLQVEPQARSLVDRLEDSVNHDPSAWARWAESIATQNYRKGLGHQVLSEHLPLLASLPHELLSSLLPQGGPSSHVTLKTICGAGFLQTILFSVLASFSLSAVLHAAEVIVAGATGIATPLRRLTLPRLLESDRRRAHRSAAPVLCLCDSEASSVVDTIHRIHQTAREDAASRKVIQLSLTDLVANTSGKAGQSGGDRPNCWSAISPAAECAATPSGVLELLEECKDLGYWLLLHLQTNVSRLSSIEQLGLDVPQGSFQLLERIWFNCSTTSFQSTADEKFRLFVIIDCRCPTALPSWLFRCGRSELCVVDSAVGTPSLRSWLEEALDAMPRRAPTFASSMVVPSAPSPASSKVGAGYKTLADAANGSQLAAEGKMGRVMASPVLCSKLAQTNFPLKLQTSGQRLAMLVLAAACDGGLWPKCVLKTRSMGGPRVAEVVEELHFDATLRSVDLLEVFASLALQQAQKCPIWPDAGSLPGPSTSAVLYNLLRHIRQVHLFKLQEIFAAPTDNQKGTAGEVSKRSSAARTSQLNVFASAPRRSRKNMDTQDLDEFLWYHDEHFESKDSVWKTFATLVDAMERISSQGENCGEAEEQQLQDALKMMPLLEPFSIFRIGAVCDAIFTLALAFSTTRGGRLKLPELPEYQKESVTPEAVEAEDQEDPDVEVDEVQESHRSAGRKVSGVATLQFKIPSMERLASEGDSNSEDEAENTEVVLSRAVVNAHSASRIALMELFKATKLCVESSTLPKISPRPEENESPLQAEWRRQRSCTARWAWDIHAEATALLRGLEGDSSSPKMSLKLRHLLHSADLWAARAEPEDTVATCPVSGRFLANCPIEVWHVAKSHAATTLPVPEGWQPPHFRDEATFGSWLSHLATQLYEVYALESVPRNLRISELAQLEPLLLSLRLCLAGQRNLQVEQTCLLFLPSAPSDEEAPDSPIATSSRSEHKAVSEEHSTWDELDSERPPAFKPASTLPQQLVTAMTPLSADKAEVGETPSASSTEPAEPVRKSTIGATFAKSVRKVQMMASLAPKQPGRRSTVRPGTKKLKEKDPSFVSKEVSEEDLVLQGLLADGAVWSSAQGLHIDSNVAGVTRLPPLRVVAATLKAAEYILSQAFPQANGCMNLFVHRLFGSPWPLPSQSLVPPKSVELFAVRLPFWSKPQNRWQPVMLLDDLGPFASRGHLRQWEEDNGDSDLLRKSMEDHLEEPLSVARPFGLLPTDTLLSAMAGPLFLSKRKAPG